VNEWGIRLETKQTLLVVRRFRELEGLDALWEVSLKAWSDSVSLKAGAFLVELYLRLRPQKGERRVDICMELVRRCMDRMGEELAALRASPEDDRSHASLLVIARSLKLLLGFLEHRGQPPGAAAARYLHADADTMVLRINVYNGPERFNRERSLELKVERSITTYGAVRARVAREMRCGGEYVRLQRDYGDEVR
jgi:hypothetical protein